MNAELVQASRVVGAAPTYDMLLSTRRPFSSADVSTDPAWCFLISFKNPPSHTIQCLVSPFSSLNMVSPDSSLTLTMVSPFSSLTMVSLVSSLTMVSLVSSLTMVSLVSSLTMVSPVSSLTVISPSLLSSEWSSCFSLVSMKRPKSCL